MKRIFSFFCLASGFVLSLFIQSCKEDNTPPEITIIGDTAIITPKEVTYNDAGATASDDKDDYVYVVNNISGSNPDIHTAGKYTIVYTAQDRNANSTTATRSVYVTYTNWQLAASSYLYQVHDVNIYDTTLNADYPCTVLVDTNYTYRTFFNQFHGSFSTTEYTYLDPVGNKFTIPSQRPAGPFSPYIVEGTGTISQNPSTGVITWSMHYTFTDTTGAIAPQTRNAVFVLQ